jgi:hypothetical protein
VLSPTGHLVLPYTKKERNQSPMFQTSKIRKRCAAGASISVLLIVSLVFATEAGKKRTFHGRGEFLFCKKGGDGRWEVFDKWTPDLTFKASVTDIAGRQEFTSDGTWSGESEKGHRISFRLSGTGKAKVSLTEGTVEVEVPFAITIDGKSLNESFKATSETTDGATGPISGKRAVIDSTARTLTFAVVGSKQVRVPFDLVNGTSETRADNSKGSADADNNRRALNETILVVSRLEGKFRSGD